MEKKGKKDLHEKINDERRMFVIQAVIVRIMKAKRTLKYELLMPEVIQQLTSHFKPNISIIKVN